jgi:hypothetical protein
MNAMRVGGIVLAAITVIPVFILFRVYGNVRRELSEAGIREPELTLQMLSGLGGGKKGFIFAGWTLGPIGGELEAVFSWLLKHSAQPAMLGRIVTQWLNFILSPEYYDECLLSGPWT